ncbi:MAG: TatD family hydrolase [Clostridia bacterium]|nr:TatD family hydrolase [Clostridia bacterium]
MIIDSHAHYAHEMYEGEFSYIDIAENGYGISHSDRSGMFERMRECGITAFIEAATSFKRHEEQRELAAKYRGYVYFSAGLHPKECAGIPLNYRGRLRENAAEINAVAIGETGLDYSMPRLSQHRPRQKRWFVYQLKLADELKLPLILHVRDADKDALKILKKHSKILHGGVAHCFHGDYATASEYIALGFTLGIGSKLLEDNGDMQDAIRRVPLSSLIVETDAPYLRPDISRINTSNRQKKKARNSSLILPSVIEKIAELRGESRDEIEKAIYENTLRAFRLTEAGE